MKTYLFTTLFITTFFGQIGFALADTDTALPPPAYRLPENVDFKPGDALTIISTVANWIFSFLLIVAVIYLLLGAFKYLTAAGKAEKISEANRMIVYAIVAVAFAMIAKGIITVIGGVTGNNIVLPD